MTRTLKTQSWLPGLAAAFPAAGRGLRHPPGRGGGRAGAGHPGRQGLRGAPAASSAPRGSHRGRLPATRLPGERRPRGPLLGVARRAGANPARLEPSQRGDFFRLHVQRGEHEGLGPHHPGDFQRPMANIPFPTKLATAGRKALEVARAAGLQFEAAKFLLQGKVLSTYYDLALLASPSGRWRRTTHWRTSLAQVAARVQAGMSPRRTCCGPGRNSICRGAPSRASGLGSPGWRPR